MGIPSWLSLLDRAQCTDAIKFTYLIKIDDWSSRYWSTTIPKPEHVVGAIYRKALYIVYQNDSRAVPSRTRGELYQS